MEDIYFILSILKVRPDYLSKDEINALLIYSVNQSTLLNSCRDYYDNMKIERLIDTLAFIMEMKVYKNNKERNIQLYNYENDIRAMGWTDDYTDEIIKLWSTFNEDVYSMWGHRMIKDRAKNWLTSNLLEYITSNAQHDFVSKGDNVY